MATPALDMIEGVVRLHQANYYRQPDRDNSFLSRLQDYQRQGTQVLLLVDMAWCERPKNAPYHITE